MMPRGGKSKSKASAQQLSQNPDSQHVSTRHPHYRPPTDKTHALETFSRCPSCDSDVVDSDEAIPCDFCGYWYHLKCSKMSSQMFRVLSSGSGTDDDCWNFWCCQNYRCPDLPRRLRSIYVLEERQLKIEQSFASLTEKVDAIGAVVESKIQ